MCRTRSSATHDERVDSLLPTDELIVPGSAAISPVSCSYELSTDDKLTVYRARKIQRFLSQPFSSAQVFTGREGRQVAVADTVRGFKEILDGKHDSVPEGNFYMKGGIEEIAKN